MLIGFAVCGRWSILNRRAPGVRPTPCRADENPIAPSNPPAIGYVSRNPGRGFSTWWRKQLESETGRRVQTLSRTRMNQSGIGVSRMPTLPLALKIADAVSDAGRRRRRLDVATVAGLLHDAHPEAGHSLAEIADTLREEIVSQRTLTNSGRGNLAMSHK